jgi:hypothetical protein
MILRASKIFFLTELPICIANSNSVDGEKTLFLPEFSLWAWGGESWLPPRLKWMRTGELVVVLRGPHPWRAGGRRWAGQVETAGWAAPTAQPLPPKYLKSMDEGTTKTPAINVVFTGVFCLEWCSNFVVYEYCQKQSVKLLQNMVYNTTQHPHPPPTATHCIHCMFTLGRGGGLVSEKAEGQQFTRGVENTKMTDCISVL